MQLSDAEWKVMNVLWTRAPASVREVHESVSGETEWAYSTVKTLLSRLVDKGAVAVERRGHQGFFEPRVSREDARRSAVRSLLERAFGGAYSSLIHHIVDDEKLSEDEQRALRTLLEESEDRSREGDPR